VSLSPVKITGSMELLEFYCLGCLMLCSFCFPSFSQNGNGFKRLFINSTFYSSGTFLVSTARHARSRAIPNTNLIHTKTWFCGNETFSRWICFLLLFIHNFILLITAWSLIQICKGKERERGREINIWKKFTIFFWTRGNWNWKQNPVTKISLAFEGGNILYIGLFFYNLRNKDRPWQCAFCYFTVRIKRTKPLLKIEPEC